MRTDTHPLRTSVRDWSKVSKRRTSDCLFEVMAIRWGPGRKTPVHTRYGQLGRVARNLVGVGAGKLFFPALSPP
jgi:hypothetical protein